ncbi:hypothetical protein BC830DRAFT_800692 [Chytriomyces sp. MP71]|nr:hypothetical protein BC830DRAFT_800692 [Chytriomyces sp. MP71]
MNQTNMSLSDPWTESIVSAHSSVIWIWWITLSSFIVQSGFLSYQMRRENLARKSEQQGQQRIWVSPIDAQVIGIMICNLITNLPLPADTSLTCQIAAFIFGNLLQLLILFFTWYRAHLIVNQVMPRSKYPLIFTIILYGGLQILGVGFQTMFSLVRDIESQSYALTVVSGLSYACEAVAFCLESLIVLNYILYLRRARAENSRLHTDRLAIVARYGVASFCCFQLYLIASIGFCFVNAPAVPIVSPTLYTALYCAQQFLPLLYIQIQLGMKWSISSARELSRYAPTVIRVSEFTDFKF